MLYYYAFTSHKIGLDRVKKAAAILKGLEAKGIEYRLLVNDFRAGLVAREFGVNDSINIETIQDIDAIAEMGNVVIIDSPEDDKGRLQKYCTEFKQVFRFAQNSDDSSRFGEIMFKYDCDGEDCISALIVDDIYFEPKDKEERTLFFLNDSDYDKVILNNKDLFVDKGLELLLGNYFFVKYEDDLKELFSILYEPEDYIDLIRSSSHIITASFQTALEAKVSAAEVSFINLLNAPNEELQILENYGIKTIETIENANNDKTKSLKSLKPLKPMLTKTIEAILSKSK